MENGKKLNSYFNFNSNYKTLLLFSTFVVDIKISFYGLHVELAEQNLFCSDINDFFGSFFFNDFVLD